jgi:hypothetical protein
MRAAYDRHTTPHTNLDPSTRPLATVLRCPRSRVDGSSVAAVDPAGKIVYLTEDEDDSRLYRFVPDAYPDLSTGRLQAAIVNGTGRVAWKDVPATAPDRSSETTVFRRGEGMVYDRGVVVFTTTSDNRVWGLDTKRQRLEVVCDGNAVADAPLTEVDNVTVHRRSGDLFVAEDSGNLELCVITATADWKRSEVAPFVRVAGPEDSEITQSRVQPGRRSPVLQLATWHGREPARPRGHVRGDRCSAAAATPRADRQAAAVFSKSGNARRLSGYVPGQKPALSVLNVPSAHRTSGLSCENTPSGLSHDGTTHACTMYPVTFRRLPCTSAHCFAVTS